MAADVGTVMDDLGTALAGITGLRVYDFPPKSAQPPFAFVDMPDRIDFDAGFGRGQDRLSIRVIVAVADVVDREVRDQVAAYAAGSGAVSVKAALDNAAGLSTRVQSVEFGPVNLAGTAYFGAIFTLDISF